MDIVTDESMWLAVITARKQNWSFMTDKYPQCACFYDLDKELLSTVPLSKILLFLLILK